MRICIFASGSGGNCLLLSDGSTHVLVDAGISMRRIEASLREADIAMRSAECLLPMSTPIIFRG